MSFNTPPLAQAPEPEEQGGRKKLWISLTVLVVVAAGVTDYETKNWPFDQNDGEPIATQTTATGGTDSTPMPEATTPLVDAPVIVLDPGHGGVLGATPAANEGPDNNGSMSRTDPETGLRDADFPNEPEQTENFQVATMVKANLEAAGYTVVMTKQNEPDQVYLRDRANIAKAAGADLAVSIHDDHAQLHQDGCALFEQVVGGHRGDEEDGNLVTFKSAETAALSHQYALAIQAARRAIEGCDSEIRVNSFKKREDGNQKIEPGNIPMVELFADADATSPGVPWVYIETGAKDEFDPNIYAQAITKGIEDAIPLDNSAGAQTVATTAAGE